MAPEITANRQEGTEPSGGASTARTQPPLASRWHLIDSEGLKDPSVWQYFDSAVKASSFNL